MAVLGVLRFGKNARRIFVCCLKSCRMAPCLASGADRSAAALISMIFVSPTTTWSLVSSRGAEAWFQAVL